MCRLHCSLLRMCESCKSFPLNVFDESFPITRAQAIAIIPTTLDRLHDDLHARRINAISPEGDMFLPIFLNALVHVLMYSHYLVTALGIKSWWRQYLTSLQLAQFCLISLQSAVAYSRGPSCGAPDWAKVGVGVHARARVYLIWYVV